MAQKRDIVRVSKSVMGRTYRAEGPVQATQWDRVHDCQLVQVQGDWWLETNDLENCFELIKSAPEPEPELPHWAVGYCHYCGMLATSFGFFDEPVCRECGG